MHDDFGDLERENNSEAVATAAGELASGRIAVKVVFLDERLDAFASFRAHSRLVVHDTRDCATRDAGECGDFTDGRCLLVV